jgi:hypothetical protein
MEKYNADYKYMAELSDTECVMFETDSVLLEFWTTFFLLTQTLLRRRIIYV